jgi:hypothetical protein
MSEWIRVTKELPPCDGLYEVSNHRHSFAQGVCYYDGYGFLHDGTYRTLNFWRHHPTLEKKYGKVESDNSKRGDV